MRLETVLRWTARSWGIASALLLCAFVFGGRENLQFTPASAAAFLFFPVGVVAGFALAWWRELAGGLVTVGCLALFHLLVFAWNGWVPVTPYFLLFAAPGFLHIVSALIAARRRRGAAVADPRKSAQRPLPKDQVGTAAAQINPHLGPLANNGGPTLTHALKVDSLAVDRGDNANITFLTDQRGTGFLRFKDGDGNGSALIDIGAFEL